MSLPPLISVVMAALDGEKYLEEALGSILGQSFRDFEFIIINDGSTDNTASILQRYADLDARLRPFHQRNRGVTAALNMGCRVARGKYIARMDADDIACPDRFERQVDFLERHPAVAVLGGAIELINGKGAPIRRVRFPVEDRQIKEILPPGNCFSHPSIMMRKDAFDAMGGYRMPFLHAEEYDLWLRMAECYDLANLPDVLLYYRIHARQVTARHLRQQVVSDLAAKATARIRRATGQDPPLPAPGVNADSLATLAVSRDRLTDTLIDRYLGYADLMAAAGEYAAAAQLLRESLTVSRTKAARGRIAEIHVECARGQYQDRNPTGALLSLARAAAVRPTLAPTFIRYAWRAFRKFGARAVHPAV
ncbi:MAG TPA: glycosyltransferase [archaeon]|nr:glycosyltransferase [archaeon]